MSLLDDHAAVELSIPKGMTEREFIEETKRQMDEAIRRMWDDINAGYAVMGVPQDG